MTSISGGCLCEKVRYTITSLPISQGICYCRQCQKTGGVCGSPLMVLRKDAFECPQGALSFHKTKSNRGSAVARHFCKECGSHIFSQISDVPEIVTVKAATLDDLNVFVPQYVVWIRSACAFVPLPTMIPHFKENAPLEMVLGMK